MPGCFSGGRLGFSPLWNQSKYLGRNSPFGALWVINPFLCGFGSSGSECLLGPIRSLSSSNLFPEVVLEFTLKTMFLGPARTSPPKYAKKCFASVLFGVYLVFFSPATFLSSPCPGWPKPLVPDNPPPSFVEGCSPLLVSLQAASPRL